MAATAFLTFVVAISGCEQDEASVPGGSIPTSTPRPYFTTGEQLAAFAAQRRTALRSLAEVKPTEVAWGSMTLARSLDPTELRLMLSDAGVDSNYYFEWIEPGTGVSGGANKEQMADQLRDHPELRITYVKAEAPLATLLDLSLDDRIFLVDVGGTENYYGLAQSSGLIP